MLIKDIPNSERPRERMIEVGASNLSNEELLSLILRCGTKKRSVKDLSLDLLKEVNGISNLKNLTINRIMTIKGIGLSKATILLAVVEIGRRIFVNDNLIVDFHYTSSKQIYSSVKNLFLDKKQECFYCLYFDNKQHLIGKECLFVGTVNRSVVHPREVFKYAYLYSATGIICIHNHPSGDVKPSFEDIKLTDALVSIGQINKIPILDHLIIGNNNYYSFSDNGKINNG